MAIWSFLRRKGLRASPRKRPSRAGAAPHTAPRLTRLEDRCLLSGGTLWTQRGGDAGHTSYADVSVNPAAITDAWDQPLTYVGTGTGSWAERGVAIDATHVYRTDLDGYAPGGTYHILAYDLQTGSLLWNRSLVSDAFEGVGAPSVAGGVVYVNRAGHSGLSGGTDTDVPRIYGLSADTGATVLQANYAAQWASHERPTIAGNQLIAWDGYYGGFSAWTPSTLARQWNDPGSIYDPPMAALDGTYVYAYGNQVYLRTTGARQADITHPLGLTPSDPMVSGSGRLLYDVSGTVGGTQTYGVAAYDGTTHNILWTTYTPSAVAGKAAGNGIVAITAGHQLTLLDEATGSQLLTWTAPDALTSDIVLTRTHVFVETSSSSAARVYAVSLTTGLPEWSFQNTQLGNVGSPYMQMAFGGGHLLLSHDAFVRAFTVPAAATATYVTTDTATQGNWTTAYGADGYNVLGGATSYPSYAQVSASGQLSYTWADPTTDARAPWKSAAMASRVAACWYSGSSFTIDLNITDGKTHQVSLYLLDWDGSGVRKERIDVLDAASGKVLDTETGSSFSGGDYLVWTISGHVQFQLTNLAGVATNAVVSGIFFGTGTGGGGGGGSGNGSATFLKSDTATQGNWTAAYGADGYNVIGGTTAYPSYARVSGSGQSFYTWADPTTDVRAPWKSAAMASRVAATWYSGSSFTIDLNVTDGATHQVALYLLDWDSGGLRDERIDVLDATSGKVLDTESAASFSGGDYLVWTIGGHVTFQFTNLAGGGSNAVVSGLFFGTGTGGGGGGGGGSGNGSATFLKSDTTTQGTWMGSYGADGYNVIDYAAKYPGYASVAPSGQSDYVWSPSTTDPRALEKSGPADRIAATWYSGSSFTIDLNVTDGATHQVALYLLDWDSGGLRDERIDVLDAVTGKVLDTETARSLSGGDYLVWTIGGHVTFQLTNLAGPATNAVVSGLFFG
jgi:hypothetical protein